MNSQCGPVYGTIPPLDPSDVVVHVGSDRLGAGGLLQKSELPTQKQRETTVGIFLISAAVAALMVLMSGADTELEEASSSESSKSSTLATESAAGDESCVLSGFGDTPLGAVLLFIVFPMTFCCCCGGSSYAGACWASFKATAGTLVVATGPPPCLAFMTQFTASMAPVYSAALASGGFVGMLLGRFVQCSSA